jgi:hypothetical protein
VVGNTVVTGNSFGPLVNYTGAGASDILQDYVNAQFAHAGYTNIVNADSRYYHNGIGNIHCGTQSSAPCPRTCGGRCDRMRGWIRLPPKVRGVSRH